MKMKITIDLDCTPTEARQLAGLPDLQPMHERLTAEMEQRFRDAAVKFSPDAILQQWFGTWPGLEPMRAAFEKFLKSQGQS
jgi:hypothetical protein